MITEYFFVKGTTTIREMSIFKCFVDQFEAIIKEKNRGLSQMCCHSLKCSEGPAAICNQSLGEREISIEIDRE